MSKELRPCVYCQVRPADTTDHVPPKTLFPPPRPGDLITVPSCTECNRSFAQDDEFLRAVLVMRRDVAEQPAAKPLLDALFRSTARPRGRGFSQRVYDSFRGVEVVTPAGIYVGRAPAYVVDVPRLNRSLERITRGLFYHEIGTALPADARVTVDPDFERDEELHQEVAQYLGGPLQRTIGANAFGYSWKQTPDSPYTSMWLMVFYGVAPYLVLTVRPGLDKAPDIGAA